VAARYGPRATIVRPGKVAGPYDWQDGLIYWVRRAARGGRMALPGDPRQPVQVIDSRDLGGLVVRLLADDRSGAFSRSRPGRADHDRRAHPDLRPGGGYPGRDSTGAARNGTPAVPPDQDGLAVTATQPGPS